jgi:lauroyl/myristoyl acyltransferase
VTFGEFVAAAKEKTDDFFVFSLSCQHRFFKLVPHQGRNVKCGFHFGNWELGMLAADF